MNADAFAVSAPKTAWTRAGQFAYGSLFVVALPALLIAWAWRLDHLVTLPQAGPPWVGVLLAVAGALLMIAAVAALRIHGRGWPMSPFPPSRRVTTGPYALLDDPIYAGAVLLAIGMAIALQSAAGTWIVVPVLALSCAAFVIGFEHESTLARFGPRPAAALLRLPDASNERPSLAERLAIYILVFLPWLLAYEGVNLLGVPRDAMRVTTAWDAAIPVLGWSEPAYFFAYPFLLALPLIVRTRAELRRFALQGWIAIVAITTVYLVFPTYIEAKPVPQDSAFAPLMMWERAFDDRSTGFPAFHVVWACIAASFYTRALPAFRALWWAAALAISISSVTTGMHAIADIAAALAATALVLESKRIWLALLRLAERIAASWRERDFGPVRLMSHGLYAGAGAFLGLVVVGALAGPRELTAACIVAVASIAGAAVWAQFLEGSSALQRPFGFYGGLAGAILAIVLLSLTGSDGWLVLGAYSTACPVVQAFGRVRCLVQGCCHGRPTTSAAGIRYVHPRSRVTRLSGLAGVSLHPTQVYSILWCAFMFLLLVRLWFVAAPLSFISGTFFVLNGLGRFVEEHFRGEPQTPVVAGLRVYQWLAMASLVGGAAMTAVATAGAPPMTLPQASMWIAAAIVGLFTYAAYGVDFPRLNTRFARLV